MVKYSEAGLDRTFGALADPTRRAILARLASGALPVTELAEPFAMSLPAISKHLKVLADANLVVRERQGRQVWCRLVAKPMKSAAEWMSAYRQFWEERLDALAFYFDNARQKEGKAWRNQTLPRSRRSKSRAPTPRRAKKSSARGPTRRP